MSKILVVHTAFVGDVILTTPLIRAIKSQFPHHLIDVLVIPQTASVLANNPYINKIVCFDKRKNKLKSFFQTAAIIRKNKYTMAFLPHSSFTTALLTLAGNIPARIGFNRRAATLFLSKRVEFKKNCLRIEKNLHLLSPFTNKKFDFQTEIFPDKADESIADELLKKANDKTKIALAPGSIWATKCWPAEYYQTLASELSNRGYQIVLVGAADEKELCTQIAAGRAINTAGKTSITASAAVLRQCVLLVGNDSGALHIANAVKTPVISIFGPTVRSLGYYPFRDTDFLMETELACRPCGSHGSKACPLKHHQCMRAISPEMVLNKILEMLAEKL